MKVFEAGNLQAAAYRTKNLSNCVLYTKVLGSSLSRLGVNIATGLSFISSNRSLLRLLGIFLIAVKVPMLALKYSK